MKKRFLLFLALLCVTLSSWAQYSTFNNPDYYYSAIKTAPSGVWYRQAGLSPDGTKIIAQKSWNDGTYDRTEVVLMNANGTGETVISAGNSGEGDIYAYMNPFWSDDGTAIGYVEVHNANPNKVVKYVLSTSTTSYIYAPLTSDVANPDFLGTSTTSIVFSTYGLAGGADLFTWDGTTLTNITNTPLYKEYEPVSNSDGTKILYWSGETTAEPVNTTHTFTYSGVVWTKDVGFTPIPDSWWPYWTNRADNYIGVTVVSTGDVNIYSSTGTFATDLTGPGYSGGASQWNYLGSSFEGPNGEMLMNSNAGRGATLGRDIVMAAPRNTLFVNTTTGNDNFSGTQNAPFKTIQKAINEAVAGGTVNVAAGTYTEVGQIVIDKDLSIVGADKATTIIKPSQNTSNSGDTRGWLLVNSGITFNLSNVTLDGTGKLIYMGIYYWGNGSVNNCNISNIKYNESGPDYEGRGMIIKGNVNVTNCTFSQMGRIGIQYYGGSGIVSGNNITGKGDGSWYDYGVEIGAGAVVTIENNTITGCTGLVSGDGSAAILATTYFGVGTTGTISNNILSGNVLGIAVGYDANDACTVFAHNNDLSNNSQYAILSAGNAVVDATCNWWGTVVPSEIATKISGLVTYSPWLNSGTDNEPGTTGFQPVPGSCGEIQWDGSESTSWNIPANWSGNTVPTASNNILIPNVGFHPDVNITNAACSNLTVQSGAVLTIDPNQALTVNGTLATASAAGLVIASDATGTGSLIHHTPNVQATIKRYVTGSTSLTEFKYHLVSVPLTPANPSYLGMFAGSYLYEYNPTGSWVNLGNLSPSTPLDETKGYMMYYPGASHTYSFAGPINAGLFTANVVYVGTGFNLVPNPYPSAIDWDAPSGWTRTNIGNATWIWNAANYAAYVAGVGTNGGSQYIPVGQAFFVKANAASPALAMSDGVRVHNTQPFLKSGESIANLLRIRAEGNNYSDEAIIRFVEGATNGLDSQFDASKMYGMDGAPQLYTMTLNNDKVSINSMPLSGAPAVTSLHLEMNADVSCRFVFSGIESFLPGATLLLEDKMTGTFTDLRKHSEYVFDHKAVNISDRFNLYTSTMTGLGNAQTDAGKIWLNEATLYIAAPKLAGKIARVELFNLLGQKLYETRITLNELTTLKPGVTGIGVVRVTCGSDVMTAKGILR